MSRRTTSPKILVAKTRAAAKITTIITTTGTKYIDEANHNFQQPIVQ